MPAWAEAGPILFPGACVPMTSSHCPICRGLASAVLAALLSVFAVEGRAGTTGTINDVASFAADGQDITFEIDDGSRVRLTIHAEDVLRVRFAPTGVFGENVSRSVVLTEPQLTAFTVVEGAGEVSVTTAAMRIVAQKTPFVLRCFDRDGNLILADDPDRRMQWGTERTQVFKLTQTGEKYVGLGWRTHGLVRNGTLFQMRNVARYSPSETFYSGVPLWYGIRNGAAHGVFFDDASWGTIDVGATSGEHMSFRNLGGQLDYYYFAGPTIARILDRYTELTGRPFMPPRWALGYQQSRWSYTPQSQVLQIASEFRARGIPCDVIYLDIDYMPGGRALTFDPATFPTPAAMTSVLHSQGFKVVANISPFVFLDDGKFSHARDHDYLLKRADGTVQYGWHDYWFFVGGAATGSMAWIDFTRTAARNWWGDQHAAFLGLGIDGIWNDLNEPDELGGVWDTDLKYDFDGAAVDHNRFSPQYSLMQTELSYGILAGQYPNCRPFVLSRGGCAGIQRYSALWSGDNTGDWGNDYRRNIPMGLSMSISGNPFNGHDIGGFFGYPDFNSKVPAELYARWMQCGVFSPFCRQHHDSWGNHDANRPFVEPWRFTPEVESVCRDFIGLRYRLMPYLYTLFHDAHATGEPIQRPTLYDFTDDPGTLTQDYDFMFGPFMLVSPVTTSGATSWSTYLPAGADWVNWWDDSPQSGGQTVSTAAPLNRLPIFVREGAIIPMAPPSQYDGHTPVDPLTLELYPAGGESSFTLYEDDGISWACQSGAFAKTIYTMQGIGDSFRLAIGSRQGSYVPAPRSYLLRVHRWPGHTRTAAINGVAMTEYADRESFDHAPAGCFLDASEDILYVRFADTGGELVFTFGGNAVPDVPGDFDWDGDVDMDDYGSFQGCLSGPGVTQPDGACHEARFDEDDDVDAADLLKLLGCMSGAGVIGDPECAD